MRSPSLIAVALVGCALATPLPQRYNDNPLGNALGNIGKGVGNGIGSLASGFGNLVGGLAAAPLNGLAGVIDGLSDGFRGM
jgi:hypothetical protein